MGPVASSWRACPLIASHPKRSSFETKLEAVKRFLAGQTKPHIAKDMGLSPPKVPGRWIRAYRVHVKTDYALAQRTPAQGLIAWDW